MIILMRWAVGVLISAVFSPRYPRHHLEILNNLFNILYDISGYECKVHLAAFWAKS